MPCCSVYTSARLGLLLAIEPQLSWLHRIVEIIILVHILVLIILWLFNDRTVDALTLDAARHVIQVSGPFGVWKDYLTRHLLFGDVISQWTTSVRYLLLYVLVVLNPDY